MDLEMDLEFWDFLEREMDLEMDLDFWDCFGKEKPCLIIEEIQKLQNTRNFNEKDDLLWEQIIFLGWLAREANSFLKGLTPFEQGGKIEKAELFPLKMYPFT